MQVEQENAAMLIVCLTQQLRANQTELMTSDLDKETLNPYGLKSFVLMGQSSRSFSI